ncbi:MAG: hypothetical protein JNL98_01290 [Bryobacterales bacterium]|nr:hypothetical protein [Bryobacterales bacterium]
MALLLSANAAAMLEPVVRGTVRDADSMRPVAGAKVRIAGFRLDRGEGPPGVDVTIVADERGEFLAKLPGVGYEIVLRGEADGYLSHPDATLSREGRAIRIAKDTTTADVLIYRVAELRGTVLDEGSRKPVSGATVQLWEARWLRGRRRASPIRGSRTITDEKGVFAFRNLTPNEYYFQIAGPTEGPSKNRAYLRTFFPAIPGFGGGFLLATGSRIDAGSVLLLQGGVQGIKGRIAGDCEPGQRFSVQAEPIGQFRDQPVAEASGVCGKSFEMKGLSEGDYWVWIRAEADAPEQQRYGVAQARVKGEDSQITVEARALAALSVSAVWPEGTEAPELTHPLVDLSGPDMWLRKGDRRQEIWDVVPTGEYWLRLRPPGGWAVTRTLLNGTPATGLWVPGELNTHRIEITLARRTAVVSGEVKGAGSDQATVLVVPWPLRGAPEYPEHEAIPVRDGSYRATVAPGRYRVFLVRRAGAAEMEKPFLLGGAAARAAEVEAGENEYRTLNLELKRR